MTLTHGAEGQHLYRLYLLGKSNIGLEREINMKGYKAFKKGLVCRGKKYTENTIFEEPEAILCERGMHFCKNPIEVFNYYDLVDENGEIAEFAEVEALDEPVTDGDIKYCSTKLKIHEKLSFPQFIHACVNFLLERKNNIISIMDSEDCSHLADSKRYSCITSSGNNSRIANSGDYSRIISSGYYSQQASSGNYSHLASAGGFSEQASSGIHSYIANSGNFSNIASLGDCSRLVSSGDATCINSKGGYSVICCAGNDSRVKAKKGSWITLSEWVVEGVREVPKYVKTEYVDGERIKEDTFYTLKNGNFIEVEK